MFRPGRTRGLDQSIPKPFRRGCDHSPHEHMNEPARVRTIGLHHRSALAVGPTERWTADPDRQWAREEDRPEHRDVVCACVRSAWSPLD